MATGVSHSKGQSMFTVKHLNTTTNRWHIEEADAGQVWGTDSLTALRLAQGYISHGFAAQVVPVEGLAVENLPHGGSLVEVEA